PADAEDQVTEAAAEQVKAASGGTGGGAVGAPPLISRPLLRAPPGRSGPGQARVQEPDRGTGNQPRGGAGRRDGYQQPRRAPTPGSPARARRSPLARTSSPG